jgi:dTMP kinase
MLAEWLENNGFRVETLVEPTDSEVGKLIRRILQHPDAQSDKFQKILALLFAADRMMIMDKLEDESKIIISDRSFISSLAYQEPAEWVETLNRYAKKPDLLILLDLDAKKSVARTSGEDTFENVNYLTGVRENYLKLAENYTHEIIDADKGINKVSSDIKKAVAPYLGICPDCIR